LESLENPVYMIEKIIKEEIRQQFGGIIDGVKGKSPN